MDGTQADRHTDSQTDRQIDSEKEKMMVGWFNFAVGCFYGYLILWMVGKRQKNLQTQKKRQADRQTERETERKNDGWLVGSILWMVASADGCFY